MTGLAWRELIDSFLSGRLSAASFKRRFLELFEQAQRIPAAVQDLYFVVDAYGGDPMGRGHDVADDADLRRAARRALARLAPEPGEEPLEEAIDVQVSAPGGPGRGPQPALAVGLGLGCALAFAYVAVGVLQLFAIAEQVDRVTSLGPVPSTLAALVLTFVPLVGSLIAFFGAMDGWGWAPLAAALVFLLLPALVQLSGLARWGRRFARRGPPRA